MNLNFFIRYGIIDFIKSKILRKKCGLCSRPARIFEYLWFCKICFIDEFDINKLSDWWN